MRFGIITAGSLFVLGAAFAQTLVPTPPRPVQEALGRELKRSTPPTPAKTKMILPVVPTTPGQPTGCAIRLVEVPYKENIDNRILLKGGSPGDTAMIVEPRAPACPKTR